MCCQFLREKGDCFATPRESLLAKSLEEEEPLLITSSLPGESGPVDLSKNPSPMQPQLIIACCQNAPKISQELLACHGGEVTRVDNYLFVDFGIYITRDKYALRYQAFLFLSAIFLFRTS